MKRVVGRWIFRITWMGVAWLSIGSVARAQSLETITLHHRRAEDLIPVLQPLIPDGAALSGTRLSETR